MHHARATLTPGTFKRLRVSTEANYLPMLAPRSFKHFDTRPAIEGTSFRLLGYSRQAATTRRLKTVKESVFFSFLRSRASAQAYTFSCGFKSGDRAEHNEPANQSTEQPSIRCHAHIAHGCHVLKACVAGLAQYHKNVSMLSCLKLEYFMFSVSL